MTTLTFTHPWVHCFDEEQCLLLRLYICEYYVLIKDKLTTLTLIYLLIAVSLWSIIVNILNLYICECSVIIWMITKTTFIYLRVQFHDEGWQWQQFIYLWCLDKERHCTSTLLRPDKVLQWRILDLYICEFIAVTNDDNRDLGLQREFSGLIKSDSGDKYCIRVLGELPNNLRLLKLERLIYALPTKD